MTDQTPRTEAGRRLPENAAKAWRDYPAMVDRDAALLRIAAIIEAQARTEALDVEVLARAYQRALDTVWETHSTFWPTVAAEYRAILAGETE